MLKFEIFDVQETKIDCNKEKEEVLIVAEIYQFLSLNKFLNIRKKRKKKKRRHLKIV